jgi:hypothetical protein
LIKKFLPFPLTSTLLLEIAESNYVFLAVLCRAKSYYLRCHLLLQFRPQLQLSLASASLLLTLGISQRKSSRHRKV